MPTAASSSTTRGAFVEGDFLTALLARSILDKEPGATILYDVRASRAVRDIVEENGGEAHVNRVGHAFFKTRMRDKGAAFGGEVSGHYYFRDFYCADSGTLPALLILELLSVEGKTMSELLAPLREKYFITGEINSEVEDQQGKMDEIAERYSDGEVGDLDGVSVDYEDWHFNVRPSNTEPLLRLNLESRGLARAHGGEAGRGARPDPGVSEPDPFAPAAAAGIHRLAISTPFAVGRVNVYLIDDEPLTLVDAGPNSGTSFDELTRGLAGLGHSLEDIELVILTHQHIDHLGLVGLVARTRAPRWRRSTPPCPSSSASPRRRRPTTTSRAT